MYIESLQITSFAGISGYELSLSDGVNIVRGNNEAGKSTVAEFIRYVFYGFNGKGDRERYIGFSSNAVAGSIVICDGDKRYRIERKTVGTKDSVSVYDLENGSTCYEGKVPGEVFLGMPSGLFASTAFVGQTGGSRINGKDASELLDNLLFAADEGVNVKKALKRLDDERVALLYKNKKGGKIFELENKLSQLDTRAEKARNDGKELLSIENKLKDTDATLESDRVIRDKFASSIDDYKLAKSRESKERLRQLEENYQNATDALLAHKTAHTRKNFFPDASYLQSLRDCASEVAKCDERIDGVERRLENLNREMEIDRLAREKALRENNEKKKKVGTKRGVMAALGVVSLIMLILCAALCAWMFISGSKGAGIALAVVAIAGLAGMIGSFSLVKKLSDTMKDLETEALVHDDGYEAKLDIIRGDLEEHKGERARYSKALNDLCARWDIKYSRAVLGEMVEVINTANKLETEAEHARIAYVQMKSEAEERRPYEPIDDGRELNVPDNFDYRDADRKFKLAEESIRLKEGIKHNLEVRRAELSVTSEHPYDVDELIKSTQAEKAALGERLDAFSLAYSMIETASDNMRRSVSPRLSRGASEKMASLTDGKYDEIGVDGEFSLTFRPISGEGRVTKGESFMSAGTSDITYVSLRLSLSELISGGKLIPTVFDESFSRLDDTRLTNMLKLLSAEKGQVIVLTSNGREVELLNKEGISHNYINLE